MNTQGAGPAGRGRWARQLKGIARVAAVAALVWPLLGFACKTKETTRLAPEKVLPLQTATLEELLAKIEQASNAMRSLNAEAEMAPTTGSEYSGVIEEYHDARAFVLAQRDYQATDDPRQDSVYHVRLIGQAPIVRKTVFDMVADSRQFKIHLPTKNKFIVGSATLERRSEKPIENLRPQHLIEALFLPAPWANTPHLLEENEFDGRRFYGVSEIVLDDSGQTILHRKWWFERSRLELVRVQRFGLKGELVSDVRYADWREESGVPYPHQIELSRPQDDYRLTLRFKKMTLNQPVAPEKFVLEKPEGAELVEVKPRAATESPAKP
ncbi:MAG TPA: hypothetical protein VNN18_02090 [Candidatus Xenobia bacterium]|nr:hypothetical protein [Candidatus Xenobia bacterium]